MPTHFKNKAPATTNRKPSTMNYNEISDNEKFTWMNYWSEGLWELRSRPLAINISKYAKPLIDWAYENNHSDEIDDLEKRIAIHMKKNPGPKFVRLNTRSPKDYISDPLRSAEDILHAITASMRTTDDIMRLHTSKQPIWLYVDSYNSCIQQKEYRCFIKDKHLIGITQYNLYLEPDLQRVTNAIMTLIPQVLPAVPLSQFVIDLWINSAYQARFLEINPYGLSDPCLFGTYDIVELTPAVAYIAQLEEAFYSNSVVDEGYVLG